MAAVGDPAVEVAAAIANAAAANERAAASIAGAVDRIAASVAEHIPHEMHLTARMILLRHLRLWLIVFGLFGAVIYGLGVLSGWLFLSHGDIRGMVCQDQDGGRACYIWVTPPKQNSRGHER